MKPCEEQISRSEPTQDGKTGVQKLREEIEKRQDPKGLRDRALLHLLYDLALSRSVVVGLDLEDLDLESGTIRILGKGRLQKETLTVPRRTRKILKEWVEVRGDQEGPLFVNFHHDGTVNGKRLTADGLYYVVKHLGKKTGQKVRPHGLRHTSISEAVRKTQAIGMDVTKVLKFSRHKNLNTLQVYIGSRNSWRWIDLVQPLFLRKDRVSSCSQSENVVVYSTCTSSR